MPDLQTQAEALLNQLPQPASNRIPDQSKLSPAEVSLILQLSDEGKTQTAIAQLIGCTQPTVSRCLAEFIDTRHIAKRLAHNRAEKLTKKVMDEADVDQALEVLDRIGVLEKRHDSGKNASVSVVLGVNIQ